MLSTTLLNHILDIMAIAEKCREELASVEIYGKGETMKVYESDYDRYVQEYERIKKAEITQAIAELIVIDAKKDRMKTLAEFTLAMQVCKR